MSDLGRYPQTIGDMKQTQITSLRSVLKRSEVALFPYKYRWLEKSYQALEYLIDARTGVLKALVRQEQAADALLNVGTTLKENQRARENALLREELENAKLRKELLDLQIEQDGLALSRARTREQEELSHTIDRLQKQAQINSLTPTETDQKTPTQIAIGLMDDWEQGQKELRAKGFRENDPAWQTCKGFYDDALRNLQL